MAAPAGALLRSAACRRNRRSLLREGALVLHGRCDKPPRIRHELLRVAARHLRRLRSERAEPAANAVTA